MIFLSLQVEQDDDDDGSYDDDADGDDICHRSELSLRKERRRDPAANTSQDTLSQVSIISIIAIVIVIVIIIIIIVIIVLIKMTKIKKYLLQTSLSLEDYGLDLSCSSLRSTDLSTNLQQTQLNTGLQQTQGDSGEKHSFIFIIV